MTPAVQSRQAPNVELLHGMSETRGEQAVATLAKLSSLMLLTSSWSMPSSRLPQLPGSFPLSSAWCAAIHSALGCTAELSACSSDDCFDAYACSSLHNVHAGGSAKQTSRAVTNSKPAVMLFVSTHPLSTWLLMHQRTENRDGKHRDFAHRAVTGSWHKTPSL